MTVAKRLNERLENLFNLSIDFDGDIEHLEEVMGHYLGKRIDIIESNGEEGRASSDYTKAVLISESVRLVLREISPKRVRKSKGASAKERS